MISDKQATYERQLCELVAASDTVMAALRAVRGLGLASWCLGAGTLRSLVWDHLHGFPHSQAGADVDVAYFDAHAAPGEEEQLQQRLHSAQPQLHWEIVNQAHVHTWYPAVFGQAVAPLESLADGLATWPEYATCVGISLDAHGALHVIAPHGLADLFEMRVRHNPRRVPLDAFMQRVQSKHFLEKWPRLSLDLS